MENKEELLKQLHKWGFIECPKCGISIEADSEECEYCGWKNILMGPWGFTG